MSPLTLALTTGDFDAYHPDRAGSNAYSRPRLEFKQRALGWARSVVERLGEVGIASDVHASDEHPSVRNGHRVDCQWVFFWRAEHDRAELDALLDQRGGIADLLRDPSPYYRHAFLALRLDFGKIEVSVQVHPDAWIDFEAVKARVRDAAKLAAIVEAVTALPEQFRYGISGRDKSPVSDVGNESFCQLVERVGEEGAALWIGWTIERCVALEHADLLDEQLGDALMALAPLYQLLSWREDDDPAGLKEELEKMRGDLCRAAADRVQQDRQAQQERELMRERQTERSRERTRERVDYETNRARPNLANLFKSDSPVEKPARQERKAPDPPAAMPHGRKPGAKTKEHPKQTVSKPRKPKPTAPAYVAGGIVDKGSKVRVLSGPFEGKVGVVGELDGRGGARVLLGLLSTRLLTEQLEAVVEAKDRPALQSSHRRNGILGRSGK